MRGETTPLTVDGIGALARGRGPRVVWVDEQGPHSWAAFGARVEQIAGDCTTAGVRPGEVVLIPAESRLDTLAWGFGAAAAGAVVAPLGMDRQGEAEGWGSRFKISWRVRHDELVRDVRGADSSRAQRILAELRSRGHPGLILSTGGTTGAPKLVLHDLAVLLSFVPVRDGRMWRTLPLMRFDHIGGLDMAWRALAGGQTLVKPPESLSPESVALSIEANRVEVLPATPSFLNLLLLSGAHRNHDLGSLRIVPYGAEPMPEGLLERLRAALPRATFVQRFGTSETGTLPLVPGGAGLKLQSGSLGYGWKVVGGELWVLSPSLALGYLSDEPGAFDDSGWFRTGDIAEQLPDGSIRVLGRRTDLINVGGEKVIPSEVEGWLLSHPLVADCRVRPEASAVLGQVVAAEIVWLGPEDDPVLVKRRIHEFATTRMARHKLPVVVRLVDGIGATRNLKKARFAPV